VNEWFTPQDIIDRARLVLGEIDLDPASHIVAQQKIKARKWFSKEQDGLTKDWSGRVRLKSGGA
jgi:ParB family transcriptional regulator, chromosome partitioning protein